MAIFALLLLFSFPQINAQSFSGTPNKNYRHSVALSGAFKQWEVYEIDAPALLSAVKNQSVPQITLGAHQWHLNLSSSHLLAPGYTLQVATPEGKQIVNPTEDPAYRGYETSGGGQVRLTLTADFIYGFVEEGGETWYVEPLWYHEPGAAKDLFVVYADKDVIPTENALCLAKEVKNKRSEVIESEPLQDTPEAVSACYTLEIAIASDKSMFTQYGTVTAVQNHNIGVLNAVQANYTGVFSQDIQFAIVTQLVITGTDPWTNSTDAGILLNAFRLWGENGGFGAFTYDLGELWTNRSFDEGVVGVAFVDAICTDFRYHCFEDFTGSAQQLRCMAAHEIGHNFSCGHDPETGSSCPPSFIMCPFVSTTNTWSNNSKNEVNSVLPFLISSGCLTPCAGGPTLTADFTWSPNPSCQNTSIHFTDASTGTITGRSWTFQGGTPASSTQQNPNVIWATAGTFNVTLTITGAGGPASITKQITISPKPTANFTYTMSGNTASFTNTSVNADTYFWEFGNGFTSVETSPQFTYPASGTYNVTLTATNSCGTSTKTVAIKTAPTAGFNASPQTGCTPLTVQFINQSTGSLITGYNWQFPGGTPSSSTSSSPIVVYNSAGEFDVTLTVTNSVGTSSLLKEGFIVTQSAPAASFTWLINNLNVQFTNTSSGGSSYSWDFGDGMTSDEFSPSHTYATGNLYPVTLTVTNNCGSRTFTRSIQLEQGPTPAFTPSVTSGCGPLTVTFTNQSSANADTYAWSFPGGNPAASTDVNPTVVYNQPGVYSVTLIATNEAGSTTLVQQDLITVNAAPTPVFGSSTSALTATFSNSTTNATSYSWNFGDGSAASTQANPVHTYATDGTYTVTLTATNACGSSTTTHTVTVVSLPTANFSTNPALGCAPQTVQFTNQSSANATSYNWSFPGGVPATSTVASPSVVYSTPGTYAVTLIVGNAAGLDTIVQQNAVFINSLPNAAFSANMNGANVSLVNNTVNANTYLWNFGDGSAQVSGASPGHTYQADGTYTIVLSATNACGTSQAFQTVTVVTPPTAGFTATQTSGCAPLTVQFNNQSSVNAVSFQWSFPGGSPATSTQASPAVVYANPGIYTVTLIAGNTAGADTIIQTGFVVVNGGPTAAFTSSVNNLTTSFSNTSSNASSFVWDFGDASATSAEANPNHTYATDGTYTVTLTATNACGSQVVTHTVTVASPPTAAFAATQTSGCAPLTVQFSNQSSNNATSFLWTFPGGSPSSSTAANPVVVYATPGAWSATLTASNTAGASSISHTDYITVLALPTVHFETAINGSAATFTNGSQNGQSYFWNFGDTNSGNNTSSETSPSHTFSQDGNFTVTLTVMNSCGAASLSEIVTIATPPAAAFTASATSACAPAAIQFQNGSSDNSATFTWVFEGGNPAVSDEEHPLVSWDLPGSYMVTLTAINATGSSTYTDTIVIDGPPVAGFSTQTAGLSVVTANTTSGAVSYFWDFGDPASGNANTSTEAAPVHDFSSTGTYSVTLIAENECGVDTFISTVVIAGDAPIAAFSTGGVSVACAPASVQFNDISAGAPNSWFWQFPGGEPATSTEQNPVVTYSQPGTYTASLTSGNIYGSNTVSDTQAISVIVPPNALFGYVAIDDQLVFSNASTGADTYFWHFGDGDTSTLASPQHTYTTSGTYNIVLIAGNYCGADTSEREIVLTITGTEDAAPWDIFRIYPNPNQGRFTVEMSGIAQDQLEFAVFNTLGQQLTLETVDFRSGYLQRTFDYSYLPAAMYTLRISSGSRSKFVKIAVQR
ncbi:MAG TPA: PKD domain-containing protein [Saprospiraceae bacterium]|nr:PKD domain-containing protein [Saprospiraceae bacterium]